MVPFYLAGLLIPMAVCIPSAPSQFAVDPPRISGLKPVADSAFAFPLSADNVVLGVGSGCEFNISCANFNAFCSNKVCRCLPNFNSSPTSNICQIAPGYNERCFEGQTECRTPFVCNSTKQCDCGPGFIQEYFQCMRNCPENEIVVNGTCQPVKLLDDECEFTEQCIQSYAECSNATCACIKGAGRFGDSCTPINQCPVGKPAEDSVGEVVTCVHGSSAKKSQCSSDHYCLFAELTTKEGVCCPKLKMKCPIGNPLANHNCSNCPWETHHCFSYVIGSFTDTMCCPNACPVSQPIQKDGRCFGRVAFGGNCMVDEQCYSVVGAVCRSEDDSPNQCGCPEGPYYNHFGKCIRKSFYGEPCKSARECNGNTQCSAENRCDCPIGWVPRPTDRVCVPKPNCPVSQLELDGEKIEYCGVENGAKCGDDKYCYKWWTNSAGGPSSLKSYSLCCPIPTATDFESLCKPFNLRLLYDVTGSEPLRCAVHTFDSQKILLNDHVQTNTSVPENCPAGAACLFDPYMITRGVCCGQAKLKSALTDKSAPSLVAAAAAPARNLKTPILPQVSSFPAKGSSSRIRRPPAPDTVAIRPAKKGGI